MLTDNNQISSNWFVIIHHLTKVAAQIIQCTIFERNELSITLSTLWCDHMLDEERNKFLVSSYLQIMITRHENTQARIKFPYDSINIFKNY